ncbi:MAG: methyltransferase regulatory domain-containing protein [Acetobacteraceae bacterium]
MTAELQAWSGGYVADVEYLEGVYPQQSPGAIVLACLLGGVACDLPGPEEPAHYLELGCGHGMNALLLAASNAAWQVTGIDYNPAHIAAARAMARAAGIDNVTFLEADLQTFAGTAAARAIPQADFASLHGVWTWVAPAVRQGIVRLLGDTLRPGGAVHVSYNALPAWAGVIGMQRLVFEGGGRLGVRSDRQAQSGLELARELSGIGAHALKDNSMVQSLLKSTQTMQTNYLSHEYMNAHWAPAFHADVAAALSDAKLDWAGAATPLENFPQLMLSEAAQAVFNRFDDPIMRELIKDTCLARPFRHDVYVRGARRLSPAERDRKLRALTLIPIVKPDELTTTIEVPAGKAELGAELQALGATLMEGPATVQDLLARASGKSNPAELAAIFTGTMQAQIALRPEAAQTPAADRLNLLLGRRVTSLAAQPGTFGLACAKLGAGFLVPRLVQFLAARLIAGERDADAPEWIRVLSSTAEPDQHEEVVRLVTVAMEGWLPTLRALGIVPA